MKMRSFFKPFALACLAALTLCTAGCAAAPSPTPEVPPAPSPTLYLRIERVTPAPTPSPTPVPDALTALGGVYTFAWISDPQHYSEAYPEIFETMTRFLKEERARLNLAYVVHTGDMVQDYDVSAQWDAAEAAMRALADIPHGVLAGNHDVGKSRRDFSEFNARFGGEAMEAAPYCGGIYKGGMGHYDLIDAGNTGYVFAYMGYQPDDAAVRWLASVFDQYPERVGVLCVHDYFRTDLSLYDSGKALQKNVLAKCPNVYLVLCGHRYNVAAVPVAFDDDGDGTEERTVYQMIANYQAAGSEGGSGYMRFLQIDEAAGVLRAYSYSPYTEDYRYWDEPGTENEKYPVDPANEEIMLPLPWA